ncbi:FAD:protein FMN transferase [Spirilliplanes yamanashiensis]|uniref:FAD:protein FMN transferase n=1 Tax=Spirilliplanes yamanashiensis TaxID=42233 RepID=A0A8J3Y7T6_9ACTN|nr:FAD:protein FMN transferase [Spirilliplanes yamanashiensis]MDP9816922.1 thiamine biosynthesis lipoprotein [Spirilliplanes yamanashiensis]GIJ03423.1 FAD:protein FMN transferase [Spirilliplanes yamanashiensis]
MTAAVLERRAWVEQVMGLPVSVHVRGPRPGAAADAVARLFAELRRADAVFSPYRDDSELNRLERGELALRDADHTMPEVLHLCGEARRRTAGWFDARGLPDPRTGRPRLDPSGLVKGWAAERAAGHLAGLDGHGWCLNAGGDVLVSDADGHPPWRVGIEDPAAPGRILRVVEVRSGAVATSGDAHRGAHIVDPHTGRPATAVRSVSVRGPSLMWADVHATAAAARGSLAGLPPGYSGLLVARDGTVTASPDWPG